MKKSVAVVVVVGIALLVLGVLWFLRRHGGENYEYQTAAVTHGTIRTTVSATGTINPVRTVQVGSQVSGTIQSLFADYNSVVKEGQIIAQIDPAKLKAEVERTEGERLRTEAALTDARRTLQRMTTLFQQGLIAQGDVDTATTNAQVAEAQYRQAVAQRDLAKVNLDYATIASPVNGIVIARNVDVGQTVAASLQAPTLFLIANDLARMQIDTNVDEADIGGVREKQRALFTVDAYPDDEFEGEVVQVRHAPIIEQNVVKYDVVVTIDNRELTFKPGMTANVSIVTHEQPDVLLIPNAALRFRPPQAKEPVLPARAETERKRSRNATVWVLRRGKPSAVQIVKGLANDQVTEVVSGVAEGDVVVTGAKSNKAERKQQNPFAPRMRF